MHDDVLKEKLRLIDYFLDDSINIMKIIKGPP